MADSGRLLPDGVSFQIPGLLPFADKKIKRELRWRRGLACPGDIGRVSAGDTAPIRALRACHVHHVAHRQKVRFAQ